MARLAKGPSAYHARLEAERVAKLEARVQELEARLEGWVSPFQLTAKIKQAVATTYAEAHRDGYRAGWSDKECGVAPHQYPPAPDVARTFPMMMTAADR